MANGYQGAQRCLGSLHGLRDFGTCPLSVLSLAGKLFRMGQGLLLHRRYARLSAACWQHRSYVHSDFCRADSVLRKRAVQKPQEEQAPHSRHSHPPSSSIDPSPATYLQESLLHQKRETLSVQAALRDLRQ